MVELNRDELEVALILATATVPLIAFESIIELDDLVDLPFSPQLLCPR